MVRYHIQLLDLSAHLLQVDVYFTATESGELRLPAWIPGSYMVRDFAKHIMQISAKAADSPCELLQLDKQRWRYEVPAHSSSGIEICVSYTLYAFDLSVRANYLSSDLLVLNPAAACLEVVALSNQSHQVCIEPPKNKPQWQLACALSPVSISPQLDFSPLQAENYQHLIDNPIMAGELAIESFAINDIPHHLVFVDTYQADLARIARDLEPICKQQIAVFGGLPADLNHYWFLNWAVDQGYGGLEHLNSTLLMLERFDLPNPNAPTEMSEGYQNYLALCSHEYFHLWWVKRAKPSEFLPYELSQEQYTRQLWLYEGFTSYFDDLSLVRAQKISIEQYLTTLSKTISRLKRSPANTLQSLADSSFNAWTKFYKQDENASNAVVSYYAKGSLVALCLDAALRQRGFMLEDLMRSYYREFSQVGSTDPRILALLLQLCHDPELVAALKAWIQDEIELPLTESLEILGIELCYRESSGQQDLAGTKDFEVQPRDLGFSYEAKTEGLIVKSVVLGTAAHRAGIACKDQIVAIDGLKASEQNLQQVLNRKPLGSQILIHLFRAQRLLQLSFELVAAAKTTAVLSLKQGENSKWLQGN